MQFIAQSIFLEEGTYDSIGGHPQGCTRIKVEGLVGEYYAQIVARVVPDHDHPTALDEAIREVEAEFELEYQA